MKRINSERAGNIGMGCQIQKASVLKNLKNSGKKLRTIIDFVIRLALAATY